MFVGQYLGQLALSSASMDTSFANVTGFIVFETLFGQAYGAKQYHMLGVHMQRAMQTLLAVSIPLALIWFYTSTILMAPAQNHEISAEAGTFNRWIIPSLLAFCLLQCLNRYFTDAKQYVSNDDQLWSHSFSSHECLLDPVF
ncbi:MATE efflux family protein DTX1-like [Pyrus ussuriensis x Pyrus communis]|uniref:MATE efflux family protein DTX1-like n=1 Tax=Pyrus ussuriensis x Pyrus communis TaxID=2448454 RepID=A0A5N5GZV4_9ROSA|nr:MATE efflux family protein DTX1-like [Pyrus ussuriensis x Pyrus communis]